MAKNGTNAGASRPTNSYRGKELVPRSVAKHTTENNPATIHSIDATPGWFDEDGYWFEEAGDYDENLVFVPNGLFDCYA
eukprot:SAG31_NODE_1769_length_7312_cov_9.295577_6_plen_79_part_00